MTRQSIDNGGWFDLETAKRYRGDTHWDGHNHVSVHTRSQWSHETLYRTQRGAYVLHSTSQWQGATESWSRVSTRDAVNWIIANNDGLETPDEVQTAADLEA